MDKDAETIVSQAEEPVPQMQTRPKRTGPKDSAHAPPLELDRSMLRLQRITDYLDAALDAPKPEVALVGGIVADLARYGVRLNQSVEDLLSECQSPREYLDAVPKGIELLLKISRRLNAALAWHATCRNIKERTTRRKRKRPCLPAARATRNEVPYPNAAKRRCCILLPLWVGWGSSP